MGRNKSFVPVRGKPMIAHVIDALTPLELPMLIVTNTPDDYASFGLPCVRDLYPNCGALGGLHTALSAVTTTHVLAVACDMPFLRRPLLDFMLSRTGTADAVLARLNDVWQVFPGVYARSARAPFEAAIHTGEFRMQVILDQLKPRLLDMRTVTAFDPQLRSFVNLNTPEDLAAQQHEIAADAAHENP